MAGYNIVFRQLDFTIVAGIINVKSTLREIKLVSLFGCGVEFFEFTLDYVPNLRSLALSAVCDETPNHPSDPQLRTGMPPLLPCPYRFL